MMLGNFVLLCHHLIEEPRCWSWSWRCYYHNGAHPLRRRKKVLILSSNKWNCNPPVLPCLCHFRLPAMATTTTMTMLSRLRTICVRWDLIFVRGRQFAFQDTRSSGTQRALGNFYLKDLATFNLLILSIDVLWLPLSFRCNRFSVVGTSACLAWSV